MLCRSVKEALGTAVLLAAGEEDVREIQAIFASRLEVERRLNEAELKASSSLCLVPART